MEVCITKRPLFRGQDPWAKTTDRTDQSRGFALPTHLADVTGMVDTVVDRWISPSTEATLSHELGVNLREMVRLCTIAHDIGKASPFFQHLVPHLAHGMPNATLVEPYIPHNLVSGYAVREWLQDQGFSRKARLGVELVVTGHHGRFPTERTYPAALKLEHVDWQDYRATLLDYLTNMFEVDVSALTHTRWSPHTIATVCSLVIVCDWLGSNTDLFPTDNLHDHYERHARAMSRLDLGGVWHPRQNPEDGWQQRFGLAPETDLNPLQRKVIETAGEGLTIVEHDTGGGKTAAALIAAEKIAHQQGRNGVYVALPTRTVASAMFDTVTTWLSAGSHEHSSTVTSLIHGKSHTDAKFSDVMEGRVQGVEYNTWFGKKRGALTPVAVGTIDHVLMCALKTPHVVLRHLGLLSKVLVIDEVHSSDTYMETYLKGLLAWCGALGVPVIALSATLSNARRQLLVDAYRHGQGLGPSEILTTGADSCVTRVDEQGMVEVHPVFSTIPPRDVEFSLLDKEPDLSGLVDQVSASGGVVGVIADTVSRAQRWYEEVRDAADGTRVQVVLLHSRFTDADRAVREQELVEQCGRGSLSRPEKLVVVSTQVIEQALDIDFDYMVTDVAPVDALVQRAGRMHRHSGTVRPAQFSHPRVGVCGVSGAVFARGIDRVYPRYFLLRTLAWLRERDGVSSPLRVPDAMDAVFNVSEPVGWEDIDGELDSAAELLARQRREDAGLAEVCALPDVREQLTSVFNWAFGSTSADESVGAVRAPDGSVEVVLCRDGGEDLLRVPAWLYSRDWLMGASFRQGRPVVELVEGVFDLGCGVLHYDSEVGLVQCEVVSLESGR